MNGWVEVAPPQAGGRKFLNINNPNEIDCIPEFGSLEPTTGEVQMGFRVILIIPGGYLPRTEVNHWIAADDLSWFLDYLFGLAKYDKRIKFDRNPAPQYGMPRRKSKGSAA